MKVAMLLLKSHIKVLLVLQIFEVDMVDTSETQYIYTTLGDTVHLKCKRKANIIQWTKGGVIISENNEIYEKLKHRHRFSIIVNKNSSEYTLQISNTTVSDQGVYSCEGSVNSFVPFTEEIYLCVMKIAASPSPVVLERTDVNISCIRRYHQECNKISLVKDGVQVKMSPLLHFPNISRDSGGNYSCFVDSYTNLTSSLNIIVKYPPEIQLTFDNRTSLLTCRATGLPEPYAYLEQFSSDRHLLRVINTTQKGITLKTFEDSGIYRCSAQNGVMSTDGLLNFSESIFIDLDGPPIYVPTISNTFYGQRNTDIKISINIYCRPSCVDVYWVTSIDNNTAKQKTVTENGDDVFFMKFHNVSVEVNGSITSLVLTHVTDKDFRLYTVVAENSVNTSYLSIYLKENAADTEMRFIEWYILTFLVTSAGMLASCCLCLYVQEQGCFHRTRNKTDILKTTTRLSRRKNRRNEQELQVIRQDTSHYDIGW